MRENTLQFLALTKPYSILILACFLFVCPSCQKSPTYLGKYEDAPISEQNYKVELLSIEILYFSFPTSAYAANDNGSGPDVYFRCYIDGFTPYYGNNQMYKDLSMANLPYKFVFPAPIKIVSSAKATLKSSKQTFDDLYIRTGYLSTAGISMYDYDGPTTFSPLSLYNQPLANIYLDNFIFREGTNKVATEKGDLIIEYLISKI